MRVALFVTCLVDQVYPRVGTACVELLRRLGCEVSFPPDQTCCGQPAVNAGYPGAGRAAARTLIEAFANEPYVVSPSGSCVAMIHEHYPRLFEDDPEFSLHARALAKRTYELSQFIVKVLGRTDVGARFPHSVTFHPSCHASRLLGVREEPLSLLRAVRDLDLLPLPRCEDCCGFGGTFAVKLPDVSGAMVDEKVDHAEATGASHLVGTDAGCLMNIEGRLRRRGSSLRVLHLAELLNHGSEEA